MTLALTAPKLSRIPSVLLAAVLLLLAACGDSGTEPPEQPEPTYRLVSLEPLAASVVSSLGPRLAISDAGQVAGSVPIGDGTSQPAFWSAGVVTTLDISGVALDINEEGIVAGSSQGDAFYWRDGDVVRVSPGAFEDAFAAAVNNAGTVAGARLTCFRGCNGSAFIVQGDDTIRIGSGRGPTSVARDINSNGVVVGELESSRGANQQAFSWQDGVFTFLTPEGVFSRANAINSSGEIAGMASVVGGLHAVVWRGGKSIDLGALPGPYVSEALGINDMGDVVGVSFNPVDRSLNRGFIWTDGHIQDLNGLVSPSDWIIERATDINDRGQIVAVARSTTSETRAAFLLDPIR